MANISTISDIFYTGDHHFYHDKILWLGKGRPFGSPKIKTTAAELRVAEAEENAEAVKDLTATLNALTAVGRLEMNEVMIERHNSVVKAGSRVYDLGDWGLKCTVSEAMAIRRRLNGQHFLISGNHDGTAKEMARLGAWLWVRDIERIDVRIPKKHKIALCHYALRTWHGSNKGVWHLYGHSHGLLPELDSLLAFDVGVDCWDYYPVSLEQVIEKMNKKIPVWLAWRASLPTGGMEF